MISEQNFQKLKYETLEHFWGYNIFRDLQEEIIDGVMHGKDTMVLLPTGGGKSLCYQLPALLLEGTCIVISPLLALMRDQVLQLKRKGIEAEYLSSELEDFAAETIYSRCKEGITKILYVSPERLSQPQFLQQIQEIKISFLAIDEAHCISEWGQDFRPSYQNIKNFKKDIAGISCIALTATATPKVLDEIIKKLDLKNPQLFQKSFRRENLKLIKENVADKYQTVFNILKYNNSSGIIYARTRKETENITEYLQKNNVKNVDFFHAGLSPKDKHAKQSKWLQSSQHTLIATNAFGMGIDKDNVRFVIHLNAPNSLENYYQEIGRAGRDGGESFTFLLWNEQELQQFDDIFKNQIPNKSEFLKIVNTLYSIFQIAEHDMPETRFQLHYHKLKNITKCSTAKIKNVLNFLHNQEIIFLNDYKSLSSLQLLVSAEELDFLPKKDAYFLELLMRNLPGLSSQKIYFSEVKISNALSTDLLLIKERIREMQYKNHLEYIDGALASIKFLKPRNERFTEGAYWNLFSQIQQNKIQKWEEMKYFVKNEEYCSMKLILSYFGEKNVKNCGVCSICEKKNEGVFGKNISSEILKILAQKPSTVEEIAIQLHYHQKENILENLIILLDTQKVKMLNFRTYMLA
ncbi:RecQ family ATP-dependent DNA helicase [Frigoriflavimonas asaccharolytica]|uniref:ATP-dependent DNA helicase RecQ n=1 Tax=Frigoriflavimonas asaccharolytica TaxID=2735899 RepID=A0A8J8K7T5_9FLAO|nr:ATP-dependent DNA helicase RecQ [Frigoriflavimonas asaccharolytica]NRS92373.1 ATP-dependent DNA helicase RecQ [Frigoriflavimonas asaccharolytica]